MKTNKTNEDAQKNALERKPKPIEKSGPDLRKIQMEASWLFESNHFYEQKPDQKRRSINVEYYIIIT